MRSSFLTSELNTEGNLFGGELGTINEEGVGSSEMQTFGKMVKN